MIACFLGAELTSERFGPETRSALAANGHRNSLLTHPDLTDAPTTTSCAWKAICA